MVNNIIQHIEIKIAILIKITSGDTGPTCVFGRQSICVKFKSAMPIIGVTGLALVLLVGALSLPGIIVGIGLLKYRSWARIFGIVLSIFGLIWIPFGTVVGVYGLWVLFSRDTERLFDKSLTSPL